MPPIFMVLIIAFVVAMMVFGKNPMDELRKDYAKYGKDPLVREINIYNEEASKNLGGGSMTGQNYVPPQGAKMYRLPPSQVARSSNALSFDANKTPPAPAPDIPFEDWGKDNYPSYMMAPAPEALPPGASITNRPVGPIGREGSYPPGGPGLSPSVK